MKYAHHHIILHSIKAIGISLVFMTEHTMTWETKMGNQNGVSVMALCCGVFIQFSAWTVGSCLIQLI